MSLECLSSITPFLLLGEGGMDPSLWGPGMWSAIHGLPMYGRDISQIKKFYIGLALPCGACQAHLDSFRENNPVSSVQSREGALLWSLRLHNSVNKKLGKPEYTLNQCWDAHCGAVPAEEKFGASDVDKGGHVFFN